MSWTVSQGKSANAHSINFKYDANFDQYVLLTADQHYDNPKCKRKLFHEHLKLAQQRNAPVIVVGDFFCLMQGKYDPRRSMSGVRPQHQKEDYINAVVDEAIDKIAPYSDLFAVVGYGNHETNIRNRQSVDVIKMFARGLREQSGQTWPHPGGYRGWVKFKFEHTAGGKHRKYNMFYTHGAGGGGAVTRGVIKSNRRAAMVDGADIVVSGHVHESWVLRIPKFKMTQSGKVEHFMQRHIQLGTYKDEIGDGAEGWANEKEFGPKPLGGYWLRFRCAGDRIKLNIEEAD